MGPKSRGRMTEEERKAARAKDKERYLQKRANMTEEEREAARAKDKERYLQKRANMTEKEKEAIRAKDRERELKRTADMAEEKSRAIRAKDKERYLQKKANMTEEEREAIRAKDRERYLQKIANITKEKSEALRAKDKERKLQKIAVTAEEKREAVRAKDRVRYLKKIANMNELKREALRVKDRERQLQKRANMTEEQKQKQRENKAMAMARRRAAESEQQKLEERAIAAIRMAQKRATASEQQKLEERAKSVKAMSLFSSATAKRPDDCPRLPIMTPLQRLKSLISRVNLHRGSMNPEKYGAAKVFIKNSLLEIVSLHKDLGHLKMRLKLTLAEAVTNAVKLHIAEKCKTTELQSSIFVEIPLSFAADKTTIFQNMSDPLLAQTGKEFHPEKLSLSGENINQQNENHKIFNPSFQVVAHTLVSDDKSGSTKTIKKLACSICAKKFGTSLGLTIHQNQHIVDSNEFNCSICSEIFQTYNLMTTHYLQAHSYEFSDNENNEEIDDEFERSTHEMDFVFCRICLICFESFDSNVGLTMFRKHIIEHHSEDKELLKYFTYICCVCDKPHAMIQSLISHWKTICCEKWINEGHNNQGFVCEHCGSKLSNQKSLSSHVKIFHTTKNLVCEECGNQFKNEGTLNNHIRLTHRAEYKFVCEDCGKKFKTQYSWKQHKESVHLGVKSFVCKFCSKRLSNRSTLLRHERSHTGEKPYECKLCNKRFAAQSSLGNHEGIHKGFKCKMCGESFRNHIELCQHRQLNHRGPNVSKFGSIQLPTSCKICHKSFKNYMSLNMHKRNVHGNKKYTCDICGKVYKNISVRNSHRFSHDTFKRFGCNLCGREFRHPTNFYSHRKVAHVNENAQIVNLIPKTDLSSSVVEVGTSQQLSNLECAKKLELTLKPEQNSNATQKSIETLQADNNIIQKNEKSNISKYNLEHENSPELDDCFSDVEYDNEDNDLDNSTTQFDIAELRNACLDLANTVLTSHTKDALYSKDLNGQNSERSSADKSLPNSVKSSGANVPLGFSKLCNETSNTQLTKENNIEIKESENRHQVFIEDATANFLLADVNVNDLVRLKNEKLADDAEETSIDRIELHSHDSIDENDGQENSKEMDMDGQQKVLQFSTTVSSPCLVVKLARLFEYNCVPCGKAIFAVSQREIRLHRRTHRSTLSQNEEIFVKKKEKKDERIVKKTKKKKNEEIVKKIKKCSSNESEVEMNGSYDCIYCDQKGFVRCRELVDHCSNDHPGQQPLQCKMCPERFTCYKTLREHKSKVHDSTVNKCSSNKSDGRKKWCYDCLYCDQKGFVKSSELIDHCSNEHPGKEPLKCKMCEEMFSSVKTLREHKAKVHDSTVKVTQTGKNEFSCELCGKKFHLRQNANNHFLFMHQERKFKCDVCSKMFPTVKELERHQLRHLSTKSHLCEECGKTYFTPHELTDHLEVAHRKIYKRKNNKRNKVHPFSCNICPYVCNKESALKTHMELHDPSRKFSCDECGLRYKFYTNVITHKNYKHKKNEKRNIKVTTDDY